MSNYTATVIKSGNSYALRVPKDYVTRNNLLLGQKIEVTDPATSGYNKDNVAKAIDQLVAIHAFKHIKDPVAWQREIRKEWDRPLPGREN